MDDTEGRRPLKVRSVAPAKAFAKWLSQKKITPNQISVASIFFALLAAFSFFAIAIFSTDSSSFSSKHISAGLFLTAVLFIQLRLLCNLFDGMVAIEGGKSTASGELFNDIPDRIADPIILVAAGFAISSVSWGQTLGWVAALLALMTAYVRTLSSSIGAPVDFRGPMAKQHRMATLSIAAPLTAIEVFFWQHDYILTTSLVVIIIGSIITVYRRTVSAYSYLEHRA